MLSFAKLTNRALVATLTLAGAVVLPVSAQQGTAGKRTQLANPASQYCIDKGGTLAIEQAPGGGEVGICRFPGDRQCEEWAMFRGECPLGGRPAPPGTTRQTSSSPPSPSSLPSQPIKAMFDCRNSRTIAATFVGGTKPSVELTLSDGRRLAVPIGLSGSGARYATPDESFVFWNKGDTAFIEEKGVTTYADCKARP